MKKKAVLAVLLFMFAGVAAAACPTWAPYGCTPTPSGKMLCGCGR